MYVRHFRSTQEVVKVLTILSFHVLTCYLSDIGDFVLDERQRGLCYLFMEGDFVLDGRHRGLCYLFMGNRGL